MKSTITIKALINSSNISPKLIRATINQLGGWSSFKESAIDICNHGIDGGFGDFIYYTDTVKFYRNHHNSILALAFAQAAEIGASVIEMVSNFKCMKDLDITQDEILSGMYTNKGECIEQIQNCLAWYAGEEVCRLYVDLLEQEEN